MGSLEGCEGGEIRGRGGRWGGAGGRGRPRHHGSIHPRTPSTVCHMESLEKKGKNYSKINDFKLLLLLLYRLFWPLARAAGLSGTAPREFSCSINGKGGSAGSEVQRVRSGAQQGFNNRVVMTRVKGACLQVCAPGSSSLVCGSHHWAVGGQRKGMRGVMVHSEAFLGPVYPLHCFRSKSNWKQT